MEGCSDRDSELGMILVSALYANEAGSRFDARYYREVHTPFALEMLRPLGLLDIRSTTGIASLDGTPPPFWVISEMTFETRRHFDDAMAACGERLFADIPHYTDVAPVLQISSTDGEPTAPTGA
jgi:uncharacterized protein (TIGR02118 family)